MAEEHFFSKHHADGNPNRASSSEMGSCGSTMLVFLVCRELACLLFPRQQTTVSDFICCNLYEESSEFSALRGKVDAILANPPFSLPIEHTSRRSELFEMGYQNSDAVFLNVCLDLLAPSGILVCLLPHSLVANNDFSRLRRKVERDWNLCGVVALPEGSFTSTGNTSTRANLVSSCKNGLR